MTCKEKYIKDHPDADVDWNIRFKCPSDYGYLPDPRNCDAATDTEAMPCEECWNREIPEEDLKTPDPIASVKKGFLDLEMNAVKREAEAIHKKLENLTIDADEDAKHKLKVNPVILDSGNRRYFETGAVRDIQEGKGRCDLMPLDVIADWFDSEINPRLDPYRERTERTYWIFENISRFQKSGDYRWLHPVLNCALDMFDYTPTMFLEVAKHFEEGAKKYGENNWQKGIPVHCYIDSAVRHYLKYLRGDKDEPHDRAFVWNILCCIWTCIHKPELNEYRKENE